VSDWFLLIYKVPSEPTRYRASIWRKLRAAGAIYLQDGVATLPVDAVSERLLRGLAQEIREAQGTVYLAQSRLLGDDAELVAAFNQARAAEYHELLQRCRELHAELDRERAAGNLTFAELEENEEDLSKLESWLGKIRQRDRFEAPTGAQAVEAVAACRADLEAFVAAVYATTDYGTAGDV
jgi:hypothetical protein